MHFPSAAETTDMWGQLNMPSLTLHLPYCHSSLVRAVRRDTFVLSVFQKAGNSTGHHHRLLNKYDVLSFDNKNHLHQTPKQCCRAAETWGQNNGEMELQQD